VFLIVGLSACSPAGAGPPSPAASSPSPSAASGGRADSLVVMTYNVNYGVAGDPESIRLIEESGADVVLLQETNAAWERALRGALSAIYPHMAFRHDRRAGGLGFLSRLPISFKEHEPSPIGWFPAWRAVVDSAIGPIQLLNLHLRPPGRSGGSYVRGYIESQDVRLEETRAHLALVDPSMPAILAGDFNEDARGKSLAHLAALGFASVLDRLKPHQPTWRWQTEMGPVRWQLDHIVVDRRLSATDAWVTDGGASDHIPVLARIVRAPRGS
jgi:endonuclease/exonuclease/phosphatase (EEP) superfamily protein YafD